MLPNFKIVVCAVMFAVILFVVTGAGVVMPETYTRVGEMPEIGRPMMQRMITDEPAQAQFHSLTLTRRSEELDQLRERATIEIESARAQADRERDIAKQAVIEIPEPDTILATIAVAPPLQPSGAMGTVQGVVQGIVQGIVPATTPAAIVSGSVEVRPAIPNAEVPDAALPAATAGTSPVQVVVLPPTDAKPTEPSPSRHVAVPSPRPIAKAPIAHRNTVHRMRRIARAPIADPGAGLFGQPLQTQTPSR